MPIYIFGCDKCKATVEVVLPIVERDTERFHCGEAMKRKMATPFPAIIKPTGIGMALDALNSDKALPDRWYKSKGEKLAAAGLESPPKTLW